MMNKWIYSSAGLALIAVVFFVVNLAAGWALPGWRLDLTEQKLYTMSQGTERILHGLKEPIDLYFFYSDQAAKEAMPLRNYAKRVEELLKAYEQAAGGKIKLHRIDPQPFSEDEDKAASFGLQPVPLDQAGNTLYFGLAGTNAAGQSQIISFFQPDQETFLEYDLSRLIQTLSAPQKPVIGVLSSLPLNGGFDPMTRQAQPAWMVMEEIRQQFKVKNLTPELDQIPEQVKVLLLVHPKELPKQTLYAIDQFVLGGGKLLVFVDPFSEADPGMGLEGVATAERSSDLPELFKAWGLRLRPDQVVGDGAYAMQVGAGPERLPVRHLGWLNVPAKSLSQEDVVSAGLDNVTLASAGILEPIEGATTRFNPLVQSSEYAMLFDAKRFAMLRNPKELLAELNPTGERYTLAARISGPAHTAFNEGIEGQKDGLKQADNINVLVVADTDLLQDRMWVQVQDFFGQRVPQPWADNAALVINALDNLSGSSDLISVRTRGRFSRPFEVVDALQRDAEQQFREQEQVLNQRLADTEEKLAQLQAHQDPSKALELTPEQQATVQQFLAEKLRIRKELREVRFSLNESIERLERNLKLLNIFLIPTLLTLLVLAGALWRRRRSA